jgi:transcriptional regulator with XRE-family HTH domain
MALSKFDKRFPQRNSAVSDALAANVRKLRKDKNWTQGELGDKADVEQAAISLLENGRSNPTLLMLENIAEALGVDFEELFQNIHRRRK